MIKYLFLACVFFQSINSCSQEAVSLLCQEWQWSRTVDPYQGGTESLSDSTNWKTIAFSDQGLYSESDPWNKVTGTWKFNEDSTRIGIKVLVRNEVEVSQDSTVTDFRWGILTLTKEKLILGIQGRHGVVKHIYQKKE